MNRLTTTEAAKHLSIPVSTIKTWLSQLPITASTDSRGKRRIDADALQVLEEVKRLRADDCGYATIRRVISSEPISSSTTSDEPNAQTVTSSTALISEIISALRAENELSEKYAKATYTIGQLEERVSGLTAQLGEAKSRIILLEAPSPRPWWRFW